MARQLVVLAVALVICNADHIWIDSRYIPGVFFRTGRSPNIAFGFGSGFSSNIGGISHSTGISSSFRSGDAQAYGGGFAGADGNVFARGIGYAYAAPSYPFDHQQAVAIANNGLAHAYTYGPSVASSAHNFRNFGPSVSSAQAYGGYGSASATVHSQGLGRGQSVVSSAHSTSGPGYSAAVSSASNGSGYGSVSSSAQNVGGYRSAISSVQGRNGFGNYGTAVSAAQDVDGYKASTAQISQQRGHEIQNSGASSINGPGIQAAQSHAVNTF